MLSKLSIKQVMLTATLALAAQYAVASTVMTLCPTPDMLKSFHADHIDSHPIGFDQRNAQIILSISQHKNFSEEDKTFGGYGQLFFITSGIIETPGVENKKMVEEVLGQIQLDSETPFMYRVYKDIVIPVCSYSMPGEAIKAVVYQAPELKPKIKATV